MSTLSAQSNISPAMAEFNGSLYIAWADTRYGLHITWSPPGDFWPTQNPPDGTKWQTGQPLNEFTYNAPALCVFGNKLYIAYTGIDHSSLNVMSSQDGQRFSGKITIPAEVSGWGPALAVFGGRLFLAWTGVDQQRQLNIISSPDGITFDVHRDKRILGQSSIAAPALIYADSDHANNRDQMILAWTAPDGTIHLANSFDGYNFDFTRSSLGSDLSSAGPTLVTDFGQVTYISWIDAVHTGDGAGRIVYMHNDGDAGLANAYVNRAVLNDSSPVAPAMARFLVLFNRNPIITAYVRGDNHHLNVVLFWQG